VQELSALRNSVASFDDLQLLLTVKPQPYWSNQKTGEDYGLTVDMLTGAVVSRLLFSYQQLLLVSETTDEHR